MGRRKRRKHLLGKLIFLIGGAYALILAAAVIHSIGGPEGLIESVEENMDPDQDLVDLSSLYSESAVLLDLDTGEIAAQKKRPGKDLSGFSDKNDDCASGIGKGEDLNKQVRLSEDIFPELYEEGASMAGFLPGEHATVRDLLYGAMLPSGGECCKALAEEVAGSEEKFADLMNKKAEELGMKHTHFVNSTGLPDKKHYTTAEDLARLLENTPGKTGISGQSLQKESYTVPPTDGHPAGFTFYSLMFQEMEQSGITSDFILGGKTGYTSEGRPVSGQCGNRRRKDLCACYSQGRRQP